MGQKRYKELGQRVLSLGAELRSEKAAAAVLRATSETGERATFFSGYRSARKKNRVQSISNLVVDFFLLEPHPGALFVIVFFVLFPALIGIRIGTVLQSPFSSP